MRCPESRTEMACRTSRIAQAVRGAQRARADLGQDVAWA
jgi:hypothetical protein